MRQYVEVNCNKAHILHLGQPQISMYVEVGRKQEFAVNKESGEPLQ